MTKTKSPEEALDEEVQKLVDPDEFKTSALKLHRLGRKEIEKLAGVVVTFSQALADMELYPYQINFSTRIVLSLLLNDGEEMTGLFSRQSGKTQVLAVTHNGVMVMLPTLAKYIKDPRIQKFKKGVRIGIFAPVKEQAENLFSRQQGMMNSDHARRILSDKALKIDVDEQTGTKAMELPNGSLAKIHSAAKQAKIEGPSYHLIVTDESQDIDPKIFRKSISPMGAAVNASQVKIGTCNMLRSDFYEACQRNARRDTKLKSPGQYKNHYQYDHTVAAQYNPFYRAYVKKEIERYGFDSDEFRMAYRLNWLLERGMFIDPTAFELLGHDYSPVTYDQTHPVVVGIDVGKSDASTVVTVVEPDYDRGGYAGEDDFRCHKKILNWLELKGDDYVVQVRAIKVFLSNYRKLIRIHIDATGVGSAVTDMLKAAFKEEIESGKLEILEFIAGRETNNEGYQRMLLDLQNERIEYPNSERAKKFQKQRNFVQQMTNLVKDYKGAYLGAEVGEETPYKDFCSSVMLAMMGCDSTDGIKEVQEDVNTIFRDTGARKSRQGDREGKRGRAWWK